MRKRKHKKRRPKIIFPKKNPTIYNPYLKIVLPIFYLLCWVGVFFLPRRLWHIGGNAIEGWILFFLFFIGFPFILKIALTINGISPETSKGISYGSVFLAIPFALFIDAGDKEELRLYQKETKGVIVTAFKGKWNWLVQANYQDNGKTFRTSSKDDEDITLGIGDSVTVLYSSKTPEMSEIKELVVYYGE